MPQEILCCSPRTQEVVLRGGRLEAREQELVLPVDSDRAACQYLALQLSRVLVFTHLTTHAPVAALGTAGALIQHPTHKDPAV